MALQYQSGRWDLTGSSANAERCSSSDKFQVVVETTGMNEKERAAYYLEKTASEITGREMQAIK